MSGRLSVPPPFKRLSHANASAPVSACSVLVSAGSVVALSAAESLENNELGIDESVDVDPLGRRRSMVIGISTVNGGPARELEGRGSGA